LPINDPSVGVKISAATSEAESVAISVIGRYFMNWPTIPGQKSSGENAATRVSVAAVTGPAMRTAASVGLLRLHALAHPPFGEFRNDDGVVDQHADGQDEREQHDDVHRRAEHDAGPARR
jgi:hypothetical protein